MAPSSRWLSASLVLLLAASTGRAQELIFEPAAAPEFDGEILLSSPQPTDMPPESWMVQAGDLHVRNVSQATLLPFLPKAHLATREAVIVAPGGGFLGLAIGNEGFDVAEALAEHGIAAFVLKYRVLPTPADFDTFIREMIAGRTGGKASFRPPDDTPEAALEDARAALAHVRERAPYWGIDANRVGMMGFSAGAMLSVTAATRLPPDERPAFIAPIYPRMTPVDVPDDAPPMFVGIGSEDYFFKSGRFGLVDAWLDAGRPVEFHLYQGVAHGYGLGRTGTTSSDWLADFVRWARLSLPRND